MNALKQYIVAGLLLAFGSFTVLSATPAYAATDVTGTDEACAAIDCDDSPGLNINSVIETVIQVLSLVIGIAAVIMIMIAGFKYITASGDSSKITSAKNTLVYAIIGLIIAVLAQFIVQFVLGKTTDAADKTSYVRNINS